MSSPTESFHVRVTKDYLKFSSAHFIAYPGFREGLHGHNYRVSFEVAGELGSQGYVVDFGVVKRIARKLCDRLDEKILVPEQSDCLIIGEDGPNLTLQYEEDRFSFPRKDAILLPIIHSSAEELARYLAGEMRRELSHEKIQGIRAIEVGVEESFGQAAFYRYEA